MNIRNIHIYGDSLLIIKQMTGQFTVKAPTIIDLYTASKETCKYFDKISFTHIPREKNKRADELANEGIKNRNQLIQPLMPA
jgi:ribonuclease HI